MTMNPSESYPTGQSSERIVITGAGAVSAWGEELDSLWSRLLSGEAAYQSPAGFAEPTEGPDAPALLKVRAAARTDFDPRGRFPGRNIRPVDRTGRLAIMAAEGALDSSGWTSELREQYLVGLSLGTFFGSVQTISAFDRRGLEAGPRYVKPLDFANSVINAAAGQTAIWHGLRGTNSTVAGGPPAALQAIGQARDLLRAGRADAMLAGGAEELCFESLYGFQQAGHLALGEAPEARPFDRDAQGLILAEGSALLMLEPESRAEERGVEPRAVVLGHGCAFDPSRGRTEAQAIRAMDRAVRVALADAQLGPDDVDVVFAGSGGRPTADRAEALALASVFGGRNGVGPVPVTGVPVTAVKSCLGESLGASGGFQTLALIMALQHGAIPGIRGLNDPAAGLDLPSLELCRETRSAGLGTGLVTSAGLDGNAAALVIGSVRT